MALSFVKYNKILTFNVLIFVADVLYQLVEIKYTIVVHNYKAEKLKRTLREFSSCVGVNDVCILSAVRTPIGSFRGKLSSANAVDLGSLALQNAVEKSSVDRNAIDEFVLGNVFPGGCGQSLPFQVAMSAGMSDSIVQSCVNKLCGSGMKAIMNGCQLISTKTQEVVAVGGAESMSNVPFVLLRKKPNIGNLQLKDCILHDAMVDPFDHVDITSFVEDTIKEYKYCREELDTYALESYTKAAAAQCNNVFQKEIVPVILKKNNDEEECIFEDEEVQKLETETFRSLKPALGKGGAITRGNRAGLADGAAMLVLASGSYVLKKNLKPLARIVSYADASLNRKHIVVAISVAIRKTLLKANLNTHEIHVWEISETFPINVPLNARLLEIDIDRININGGSISLGHPFGMTGARIVVHLAHILHPGMFGCACISHATGGASAMIIQKL